MTFLDDSTVSTGTASTGSSGGGISRRALLRTGAVAGAWSVPLVQVVAAAPAHATSGGSQAALTVSNPSGTWIGGKDSTQFTLQTTVVNTGAESASGVTLTYTFPAAMRWSPTFVGVTGGWGGSVTGKVVTLTLATLAAGSSTPVLTLSSPANSKGEAISGISVTVSASNADSSGTVVSIAARPNSL